MGVCSVCSFPNNFCFKSFVDIVESTESSERISPIIAVDGVGKVLLVSGEDSSIISIISVSVLLGGLAFETNETESIVAEEVGVPPELVAGVIAALFAAEEGRKSFVTDSEALKEVSFICILCVNK